MGEGWGGKYVFVSQRSWVRMYITAMINLCHYILLRSSNIWSFIYSFASFFSIYGYVTNSQYDQLPVGLIAQLVEHCSGIAEVMGSNPIQARVFFRL